RNRRLLIAGSLLGSAGASLLLTLIPPTGGDAGNRYCNASQQPDDRGATTTVPGPGTSSHSVLSMSAAMNAKAVSKEMVKTTADVSIAEMVKTTADVFIASRKPTLTSAAFQGFFGLTDTLEKKGGGTDHWKDAQDVDFGVVQNIFQDREHQIFLMVLGAVVLWELLATSLEWTVDESLYEYLDFVDATDRYGKLWIWSYLGASVGACSIAVFVDQLNCFLSSTVTRLAVHFYGYALLVTLSLIVTVFFPVHVPKRTDHVNKTAKALALLWSDGRVILHAVTVFLTGAAGSAVQNFLFWQMQDQGSSELYMGLSVAVGLLAEILLYFFKGKLLRTFSSSKIVAVSLSLLAVQLLGYSFLWTVWSVLLIQILSAFSSGALWWVVNVTVDDIATPGMERSLHAVFQSLCYGGGASLGSFAGGFVVKHFGLAVLYRACCLSLVLWLFLFLIVQSKLPQQKKINYSRLLAADSSDMSASDEENERDWLGKAMKDESFNRNWSQQRGIS
ncbi:PREDICTED: major facilitator superfamily domain-containing protein 6-like, partial [Chlamydotis macqueenii]|uniref:major facilitator superfamily domain-containing protein 6-like n=1 Tax=Chlamydotis macqueenii TaxID=187382 RepID=UPI0005298A1F